MKYYVINTQDEHKWLWSRPLNSMAEAIAQQAHEAKCALANDWTHEDCVNCLPIYQTMRPDMQGWQVRGVPVGNWIQ